MAQDFQHDDIIPHGEEIVERFGGIRPMASKLNVPVTTVQGWKKRDAIPAIRRDEILNAAAHYDVNLKGLIADTANENARGAVRIAEDPALSAPRPASSMPQPQAAAPAPRPRPAETPIAGAVDMRQIRKTARRTSFMTTVGLLAVIGAAGYLLFGGNMPGNDSAHIRSLESRVGTIEQSRGAPSASNPMFASLQQQVSDIATVIGGSVESLTAMARDVAAGSNAPLTQRLAVIEKQLTSGTANAAPAVSSMIDRAQTMAATPQGTAEWQNAIAELRGLVTGLQGRTDQMETALQSAKDQQTALGQTLSDVSGRDMQAAAMLMALMQMRQSADRQTPFAEDLNLLKSVAGNDPELQASIDKMAPYAQTGILSPAALKRELQASANDIITAKLKGEDVSMKDKIMARLQSLLSIHKNGETISAGDERAIIDKASAQLDANDVAGAMATLQTLQGPAADAAAPFEAKASATMAAQALDSQLVNSIIARVKSGLSGATSAASSMTGVVNAGPINMAPAPQTVTPAPVPQTQTAPGNPFPAAPERPTPQLEPMPAPEAQTEPQAGGDDMMVEPDMPAPGSYDSGVTIQQ